MKRAAVSFVLVLALVALFAACSGKGKESPLMRLSAEESLAKGKDYLERKKWFLAREHLIHAFEVEPNSAIGREALLLVADAHFLEGGSENLIKAEAKYRDFQNRFPTSDKAAYVQHQIAASLARRVRRPDRDQSITRQALEAFDDLLRIFPTSEYGDEANDQIALLRGRLAESEYIVARYNYRRGLYAKCGKVCFEAAMSRIDGLLEEYPGYADKEKAYYIMTVAAIGAGQREEADRYLELLRGENPESRFLRKVEKAERRQEKKDRKMEEARNKAAAKMADGPEEEGGDEDGEENGGEEGR